MAMNGYDTSPEKCHEIEQQFASLHERLIPLKLKLKHLKSKEQFCELLLRGAGIPYQELIPTSEALCLHNNKFKALRQERQELRQANAKLTQELDIVIEKMTTSEMAFQDMLEHLSNRNSSSPYMHALNGVYSRLEVNVNHQSTGDGRCGGQLVEIEEEQRELRTAMERLESQSLELQEYNKSIYNLSGFELGELTNDSVTFYLICPPGIAPGVTQLKLTIVWGAHHAIQNVQIDPHIPIGDIVDAAFGPHALSFVCREVAYRIRALKLRAGLLQELDEKEKGSGIQIQWNSLQSDIGVYLDLEKSNMATIHLPFEPDALPRWIEVKHKGKIINPPAVVTTSLEEMIYALKAIWYPS